MSRRSHNAEDPLEIVLGSTPISVEVGEELQGRSLEVVLDHPAARVDLESQGVSQEPELSGVPHSDGIDWVLNNAFKDYQVGMEPKKWFKIGKSLRARYDYGEPSTLPDDAAPHSMLPGDDLVDEKGKPLRCFWDSPMDDLIRQVEKAPPDPGGGLGLSPKWTTKKKKRSKRR